MTQRVKAVGALINSCEIFEAPSRDALIYGRIRDRIIKAHCENKGRQHPCAGRITITSKHMLLQCELCGDTKLTFPNGPDPSKEA